MKKRLIGVPLLSTLFLFSACDSSSDESDDSNPTEEQADTDGDGETTTEEVETSNPLAVGYPSSLAISVFPTSTSSSLAMQASPKAEREKKRPKEVAKERKNILAGGADTECFSSGLFDDRTGENVTCYEFDNDMNPFNNGPAQKGGTTDGKHTDGEACLVAFARQEALEATQYVDRALNTVAGILCAVKKAGGDTSLPAEGAGPKDFTPSLTNTGITFKTASMENLGSGVYKTSISVTKGSSTFDMTLAYAKGTTEGEGNGIISYKNTGLGNKPVKPQNLQGDDNNTANMVKYVSVKFEQAIGSASRIRNRFEVRIANIVNTLDGLDSTGIINYDVIPDADENSTSNSFKYLQFDIDSETAEGNISYWRNPGGRLNEPARGFVFNITADATTSVLSGCGASGAANVSIRATMASTGSGAGELIPQRFWHPFGNDNTDPDKDDRYNGSEGPFVTGQCFVQNATSGQYEIDYDATKALSDTTVKTEIDTHGYDVIPKAEGQNKIKPPTPPSKTPKGDFKPPVSAS